MRTPGDVVPPAGRRLERAPSERYRAAPATDVPTGSLVRAAAAAIVVGAVGAAALVELASPLALSEPLVFVAIALGLVTGAAARLGGGSRVPPNVRRRVAVLVAVAATAVAEVVVWQVALGEGGVLPFAEFQWTVYGPVALLQPLAAGLAAWATA